MSADDGRGVIVIATFIAVKNNATAVAAKERIVTCGEPRVGRVTSVAKRVMPRRACCEGDCRTRL